MDMYVWIYFFYSYGHQLLVDVGLLAISSKLALHSVTWCESRFNVDV